MGQLLNSTTPEQVRQGVKVPDVELVVQRTTEAHANEVRGEQNQHYLIHCVLLRRDFPLARVLQEFEDAYSRPLPPAEDEEQQGEQVRSQKEKV